MSEHLVQAAKARHENALKRATTALRQMSQRGELINFVAVARRAGVSTDFLYNTPALRSRIAELRTTSASLAPPPPETETTSAPVNTAAVRALSSQLKEARRRHSDERDALQNALAAAHGENLELRRRLARFEE